MKQAIIIDADTLIYEASLSAERPVDWGGGLWTLHAFMDEAKMRFEEIVERIREATKATEDDLVMALSDSDNQNRWRNQVMPTYKNNRKKTRRPVVYAPLRAWVHETYKTFERPGLEGDDILGILATGRVLDADRKIMVSIDKDLKTIPGLHLNYGKEDGAVIEVDVAEANYNHLKQTLTGDTTDGYPGCPGVGPKGAEKILAGFDLTSTVQPAWDAVVAAYAKAGLSEEVALQNARVARILRASDYDFKKKEVRLWNPV